MSYTPPMQSALRASISRDLHDPDNDTFSTTEVNDLINMGIAELNRLRPKEYRADIVLVANTYSYALPVEVDGIIRVELWRDGVFATTIPVQDGEYPASGWDLFGNILYLPQGYIFNDLTDGITVWGYEIRNAPALDDDVLDIDLDGESLIRSYAQYTCFQRLLMNRALFQQWQTNANNSDVSATQLLGMAQVYASEWRALRNRVRRLRRLG